MSHIVIYPATVLPFTVTLQGTLNHVSAVMLIRFTLRTTPSGHTKRAVTHVPQGRHVVKLVLSAYALVLYMIDTGKGKGNRLKEY